MADHPKGPHTHADDSHQMTFPQKAAKLIDHWIHHNDDHAASYLKWRAQFIENELPDVADLLLSAAELTTQINQILETALKQLPDK